MRTKEQIITEGKIVRAKLDQLIHIASSECRPVGEEINVFVKRMSELRKEFKNK